MNLAALTLLMPAVLLGGTDAVTIEDFDDGLVELLSYPGEDVHPDSWALDSVNTFDSSAFSLRLFGNTWKLELIDTLSLDSGDVWQVASFIEEQGEIQGFGLVDSAHALLYAFAGSQLLNPEVWITVFQGAFPEEVWNLYQLPVGHDWLSRYGYLPRVFGIVFINDRDSDPTAIAYFDQVEDITEDLPIAPLVEAWWHRETTVDNGDGSWDVTVRFHSRVTDPDSPEHDYFWYFGDDSTSSVPEPIHTYTVRDDHEYTVLLEVKDSTERWGRATCRVDVDPGPTTYPVTVNFVGDIMLARRYELPGGIIDTLGVEGIFDPTLAWLGEAADITVANLECPLCSVGTPHPTKDVVFRGRPANVAGLAHAGIDVVSLGNNHVIDYGLEGMLQTMAMLDSNHILYSGAGTDAYQACRPVFAQTRGVNIGFLRCSDRTGQYNNYQPFLDAGCNKPGFANQDTMWLFDLLQGLDTIADVRVVEIHAGDEYVPVPGAEDEFYSPFALVPTDGNIELRHRLIDNGADLVVCHHPHVLQGFEVYNHRLIAHSLGNFTFDLNYPETYPTVILNSKIDASGFRAYSLTPVYLDDYIPRRAKGELGTQILDYLARRSRDLSTWVVVAQDSVTAWIALDTSNLTPQRVVQNELVELEDAGGWWTSAPLRLDRNGSISAMNGITPERDWQFRLGRELVWFGNCEDEGSTMWTLDHDDEFYDTIAHRGSRSLCQSRPEGSPALTTELQQRLVCYSDTFSYALHACLKTENSNETGVSARFFRTRYSGTPLGTCGLDEISGTTNWNTYSGSFTPSSGTGFFDIRLRSVGPDSGGTGRSWFDDIGIIEWEPWQECTDRVETVEPNDIYWLQVRARREVSLATVVYEQTSYAPPVGRQEWTVRPTPPGLEARPSPTLGRANLRYHLTAPGRVSLKVYNALGQEVRSLVDEWQSVGVRAVVFDGLDDRGQRLASGTYFCRLDTGTFWQSVRLVLCR